VSAPILATKLYIPPPRPKVVARPYLIERLNAGLHHKLTLISAPAGFGKTTLLSEWIAGCERLEPKVRVAWLSLDEGDSDPARFLTYLITALQTIAPNLGATLLGVLQAPQPPPPEAILTALLNEIVADADKFVLALDDYHAVDAKPIDDALTFLIEHQPAQMHLVIATREYPDLPLARLRARGQLTEVRAADLRFTPAEAADFLNRVMGLHLSAADIAALETRTEGWIAGLQLAALALQGSLAMPGRHETADFISSFTGSHQFVLDYLVEDVLQQQPDHIQTFLLQTSILERLCGPLCEAVVRLPAASGQATLEYLERANLFIVPLDNERRWYRYHHLFSELLRQRLTQGAADRTIRELHLRASQWYEDNGLDLEAFQHAAAGDDIERAERLTQGKGIPLHLRGAAVTILNWLASLPEAVLNARPSLWWRYAALLLVNGQTTGVEEKLRAAEAALQGVQPDDATRHLIGRIATARATLALTRYQADTMLAESRRALDFLPATNLSLRANAHWTLGTAYMYQGDRVAARCALTDGIALSQAAQDIFTTMLATIALGAVQEADNQLHQAAETYQHILQIAGEQPLQIVNEAHLGLARVLYEWNDLEAAEEHGRQSLILARQYDRVIDRFVLSEVLHARVKLARGDVTGAAALLAQASQSAHQKNFIHRLPEVAAAQVIVFLRQGNPTAAAQLAATYPLPLSQARVQLAQGKTSAALATLESFRRQVEAKGWHAERLQALVLHAVVLHAHREQEKAAQVLSEALALAEPGSFIRLFVDEGLPLAELLTGIKEQAGLTREYIYTLLAAFGQQPPPGDPAPGPQPLIEPLSQRELEVLQLIAQGYSNDEIGARLFLALNTVKGHNRKIFEKLQVERRTEAVARARELGLL